MTHTVTYSMTTKSSVGISSCSLLPRFHIKKIKIHTWNKRIMRAIFNLKTRHELDGWYQMCRYMPCWLLCASLLCSLSHILLRPHTFTIYDVRVRYPHQLFRLQAHTPAASPRDDAHQRIMILHCYFFLVMTHINSPGKQQFYYISLLAHPGYSTLTTSSVCMMHLVCVTQVIG